MLDHDPDARVKGSFGTQFHGDGLAIWPAPIWSIGRSRRPLRAACAERGWRHALGVEVAQSGLACRCPVGGICRAEPLGPYQIAAGLVLVQPSRAMGTSRSRAAMFSMSMAVSVGGDRKEELSPACAAWPIAGRICTCVGRPAGAACGQGTAPL
jgi:hypothetical protein